MTMSDRSRAPLHIYFVIYTIGRGKKPQVALNNVKNKLIRIIVALVRKKVYYDPKTYMFYNAKFTDVKKMLNS